MNHPNIATIYAVEEVDGETFIVMEYIKGRELKDVIASNLPQVMNLREVLEYAIQIAEGLQAAHEEGVIHRDIKSANIMISEKGQVKIMDFGLAKIRGGDKLTKEHSTLGTAAYMSPEQAIGKKDIDHRTDIWSFGVVLFEMITGQLPFKGDFEHAVIYSILNEEPEPIPGLRTAVPIGLERIVKNAITKNPDERYQHADELKADLKDWQQGTVQQKRRPAKKANRYEHTEKVIFDLKEIETGEQEQLKTFLRKNKLLTSKIIRSKKKTPLIGAFILVLLVLIVVFYLQGHSPIQDVVTIAIMDFECLGEIAEANAYLAHGLAEDIALHLRNFGGSVVLYSEEVRKVWLTEKNTHDLGRRLKVEFLVQGSVEMSGNRISINGNILRTNDNRKIWSKSFRGSINKVFILREDFIEEIIQVLQIPISQNKKRQFMQRLNLNTQAYDFYLRGQDYFQRHFETDYEIAAQMYRKALKLDPNYALAYAGLGRIFLRQYLWYMDRDITLVDSAEIFIKKALSIDPYLAEVHLALGDLYREMGPKKIDNAIKEYEEAIRLNPTFIDAMRSLSRNLWIWGRFEESKKLSNRILQLRPVHINSYIDLGFANWLQGYLDVASEYFDAAIELEPDLPLVYGQKGYFCFLNGRFSEAKTAYEKLSQLDPKSLVAASAIGQIYFFQKDTSEAIDYLRKSIKIGSGGMDYFRLGLIHEMKGDSGTAVAYYDTAQIMLERFLKRSPEDHLFLTELAIIYAAKKDDFKALDYMRKAKMTFDFQTNILRRNRVLLREAVMYSLLGMNNSALESLEKVIDSRVYAPECLKHYLGLEKIRLDPRFEKLISNHG